MSKVLKIDDAVAKKTTRSSKATIDVSQLKPRHDITHQISLLREALDSEKQRLGFFIGAGCPLGVYDEAGEESLSLIPDVAGLTKAIEALLTADEKTIWDSLKSDCTTEEVPTPNVEHILTQLRTICALKGATMFTKVTPENLKLLDKKICSSIATIVGKELPDHACSYSRLAEWIKNVERHKPVEVFTTNYDLLLEKALENNQVPFFDGFVGSHEPFFDLTAMEQDNIPSRWTRIWKLHGSVNWIKRADDTLYRGSNLKDASSEQVLIYPSHLKYDQSRRMPYLAMIDRLKAFLRIQNVVLVISGYSFADEHLNEVILEGLKANRSAQCFVLMYSDLGNCGPTILDPSKPTNLTVLAANGAIVGGTAALYNPITQQASIGCGFSVIETKAETDENEPKQVLSNMGDFHHLALFLEKQFGADTYKA